MIEEIKTRRSIRKYQNKEVSKEVLYDLLKAAMYAPTARNKQEWRYIVSNKRETLDEIAKIPFYEMLKGAGAVIITLGDLTVNEEAFCYVDCAAATQNILLEAKSLGLGTCWCAIEPRKERSSALRECLNIDENLFPVSLISIGYPDEEKGIEDRFDEKKIIWK